MTALPNHDGSRMCSKRLLTADSSARSQRGVVLIVAMIVLVVMTLAGIGLIRQLGGGVTVAGNVAFKGSATAVADRGVEVARSWLQAQPPASLSFDNFVAGYASSWGNSVDPTTFTWDDTASVAITDDVAVTGNTTRYIIQRLCLTPNLAASDPSQRCSDAQGSDAGQSHGGGSYGAAIWSPNPNPYFRVTTRVTGPRNTISYTQVLLSWS